MPFILELSVELDLNLNLNLNPQCELLKVNLKLISASIRKFLLNLNSKLSLNISVIFCNIDLISILKPTLIYSLVCQLALEDEQEFLRSHVIIMMNINPNSRLNLILEFQSMDLNQKLTSCLMV